jgi:hypothetical protein
MAATARKRSTMQAPTGDLQTLPDTCLQLVACTTCLLVYALLKVLCYFLAMVSFKYVREHRFLCTTLTLRAAAMVCPFRWTHPAVHP